MRSAEEIMTLILEVAKAEKRIRAVLINGSRANPHSKKDKFQDFDIVYIVHEISTFLNDHTWIDVFGERLILQMPATMILAGEQTEAAAFSYLMLFKDHNRIDLTLFPIGKFENEFKRDSLTILLLDKDNLFPSLPESNDLDYQIKRPGQKMFTDCCNEFWWVCTNVAKGLWRQEIIYSMGMLEGPVRKMFLQLIEWHIGSEKNFTAAFGKSGKNIQALISPQLYERILLTYPDANAANIWESLFIMCGIFSELANKLATGLSLQYNSKEDQQVTACLKWVRSIKNEDF